MRRTIKYSLKILAFLPLLALILSLLSAGMAASADEGIALVAPEINSGENLVKIGDTRYIRYSIVLDEYKRHHYSEINFNVSFDDKLLDLAFTNVNLNQIYAYDVADGKPLDTQRNIVWHEPLLDGNKINVSAYSTTGMWFREGIVIILYFLPREAGELGEWGGVELGDSSCKIIADDGGITPPAALVSHNGGVTLTESKSFASGESAAPADDSSPFKGKGDAGAVNILLGDNSLENAPLYYTIAAIIIFMSASIAFWGFMKIKKILKHSRPREKDAEDGSTENKDAEGGSTEA